MRGINTNLLIEGGEARRHLARLQDLLRNGEGPVRIVSPYVTDTELLYPAAHSRELRLITSLRTWDIVVGATSVESLRALIAHGVEARHISNQPRLHAKTYIFDSERAIVTSANLTHSALHSNLEVGVEVAGNDVAVLVEWFERLWRDSRVVTESWLAEISEATRERRRQYQALWDSVASAPGSVADEPDGSEWGDHIAARLKGSARWYVCNTNRKHGGRTAAGGYVLEEEMKKRGYAAAWENPAAREQFRFDHHMHDVRAEDVVLAYAKGAGIIAAGTVASPCEVLTYGQPGRIGGAADDVVTEEWRIRVRWLAWTDDNSAYRWKAPRFTFWDVSAPTYENFREEVSRHFATIGGGGSTQTDG